MLVNRTVIEHSIEDKIVIGMIMSLKFLREIFPSFKFEYLKSNFAKRVCGWALEYYTNYDKPAKQHIKDIFEIERENISSEEAAIIEAFLTKLSIQYTEEQEINEDYFIDKAIEFFKRREVEIIHTRLSKFVETGKFEDAEKEIVEYKKVSKAVSAWHNPLSEESIQRVFEDEGEGILHIPGKLGRFIGRIDRGWLISIVGKFGTGKSWYMQEFGVFGVLSHLKVASFSLEMNEKNMDKRLLMRLSAFAEREGQVIMPCFDCAANQQGVCELPQRTNHLPLFSSGMSNLPKFRPDMEYKPCTACRSLHYLEQPDIYQITSWFRTTNLKEFSYRNVFQSVKEFKEMWGNNFRSLCYPRFSATLSDIKRDLDLLDYTEGFIPDVIIIDYAGIIRPEKFYSDKYLSLDDIWMELAGIAEERHCVVITGSQVNRGELSKNTIENEGLAGWIGQAAHVDKSYALNQTKSEKERGIVRLSRLKERHEKANDNEICLVIQNLDIGQTMLDAEIIRSEG